MAVEFNVTAAPGVTDCGLPALTTGALLVVPPVFVSELPLLLDVQAVIRAAQLSVNIIVFN